MSEKLPHHDREDDSSERLSPVEQYYKKLIKDSCKLSKLRFANLDDLESAQSTFMSEHDPTAWTEHDTSPATLLISGVGIKKPNIFFANGSMPVLDASTAYIPFELGESAEVLQSGLRIQKCKTETGFQAKPFATMIDSEPKIATHFSESGFPVLQGQYCSTYVVELDEKPSILDAKAEATRRQQIAFTKLAHNGLYKSVFSESVATISRALSRQTTDGQELKSLKKLHLAGKVGAELASINDENAALVSEALLASIGKNRTLLLQIDEEIYARFGDIGTEQSDLRKIHVPVATGSLIDVITGDPNPGSDGKGEPMLVLQSSTQNNTPCLLYYPASRIQKLLF